MPVINAQNDLDMHQFEILNAAIQILTADPTNAVAGQIYYNSTTKTIRWYDGAAWHAAGDIGSITSSLDGKVDKVEGKGLSTEDYTSEDKSKLAGIAAGAEVNVQPDWNASEGDAAILNKPSLGTAAALNTGTAAGNIPVLNGSGKLPDSVIPSLAIGELVGTVDTQAQLTTLSSAQQGDIAKVTADTNTNLNGVYWLNGAYSTLENWIQIVGPGSVISVNGQSGVVVLDAADVGAVPTTRTVAGKALSSDVTLAASDVGAVPTTRTVNGKPLSANVTLAAGDVGAVPTDRTVNGKPLSANVSLVASDVGAVAANAEIESATHPVITYDAKGLVTGGRALQAADIPSLDASKVATGTFAVARLPTGNAADMVPLLGGQATAGQVLAWDADSQRYVPHTVPTNYARPFSAPITGDGSRTVWTFAHGLGKAGIVQVKDASGNQVWVCNSCDATNVTVTFGRAPAADTAFTVYVVG